MSSKIKKPRIKIIGVDLDKNFGEDYKVEEDIHERNMIFKDEEKNSK